MNNRFFYAQIDADGLVIGKSDLSGEVVHPALVSIPSMDACLLGDTYADGVFVTPPEPEPQPATEEGA